MSNRPELVTAPAVDALAVLRREVAALLSQIDTAELPVPDEVRRGITYSGPPGAEWRPVDKWRIFTNEERDSADVVYLDHEDLGFPGDWEAMTVATAQRIGMAFLAAAAYATERRGPVRRLPTRRRDNDRV